MGQGVPGGLGCGESPDGAGGRQGLASMSGPGDEGHGLQWGAVARASLELSAGGASTGILKGSGLGRKIPGGCCTEFLSEPKLSARKGHAQAGAERDAQQRQASAGCAGSEMNGSS